MSSNLLSLSENIKSYTAARNAANELLKYVSFASLTELLEAQESVTDALGKNANATEDGKISEKLLSSVSSVPLYDKMFDELATGNVITKLGTGSERIQDVSSPSNLRIKSVLALTGQKDDVLARKRISMVQHAARSRVDFSSALSDISAVFCNLIPPTEMSLCVPLFDVRIIYPQDSPGVGLLSSLRFVGVKADQKDSQSTASVTTGYTSADTQSSVKYGYDVAGMEMFCLPQTLAAPPYLLNTESDLQNRGVAILDPLMPLLSLESANIQQVGINGSLYAQTKIDLKIILHDRSRLSDIEALVSAEVFPTVTFRISYGWLHPDNNKFTGNVYAKLLNSMRVTQDFAVSSVNLSTKDSASMSITVSLISTGSQVSKGAKIMTANGKYIPFAAVQTLLKQFVRVKSVTSSGQDNQVEFGRVGSTITASASKGVTTGNFVRIEDFYSLYSLVSKLGVDGAKADAQFDLVVQNLDALEKTGTFTPTEQEFNDIFNFGSVQTSNGSVPYGSLDPTNLVDVPADLATKIDGINKSANKTTAAGEGSRPAVVPLSALVARLVAKPLLLTQPDIDEVRIHFFSFNSACGKMAEVNIGNFPIEVKQIIEHTEGEKKQKVEGINQRTSAESALGLLLKHVNNPASIYFGHNAEFEKSIKASQAVQEDESASAEDKQIKLDNIAKEASDAIDTNNPVYIAENKVGSLVDGAFVPARIKSQIDVLPAYDVTSLTGEAGDPEKPDRKIARIIIYDERAGGFNKLGNLVFSMINTNGIARIIQSGFNTAVVDSEMKNFGSKYTASDLFSNILSKETPKSSDPTKVAAEPLVTIALKSKQVARNIASNLYPTIVIGSDSTSITSATYSSQPSGEVASSYLLSALQGGNASSTVGLSAGSDLAGDVLVLPSSVTLNMIGNTLMARGQTYFIDFNTGTTLDNSYTVQSVIHNLRPGSFTTSVTLMPTNSASMRSVSRQLQELSLKVKGKTGKITDPNKSATKS